MTMYDLEPGYPALLLLTLTTLLSALLASIATTSYYNNSNGDGSVTVDRSPKWFLISSPANPTRALFTLLIATVFWVWAVSKNINRGWFGDWGIITFLGVIVSCVFVCVMEQRREKAQNCAIAAGADAAGGTGEKVVVVEGGKWREVGRWLMLVSCWMVAANYAWVWGTIDVPDTFAVYLGVGLVYWFGLGVWNWWGYRVAADKDGEEEEKDTSYTLV
mmetsp:Transcript_35740/g.42698  ORF Transcript_35740/g.42698 Transcript_35740/m.42698 type:complete len:218 (+) Transcript_35740:181-834(+)|eukprot:CAMPEP_0198253516 /NCGR_PEP_ID=MMETSP1447-20131203/3922_1 /TAXON_ID=420782 /ORGANISM="Chaetoceros dichaeta, Strain CCMP1751" /LENGTH=217 /DNA_ID=CAMNT_0043939211 /DNA_START=79 /DNA_END=732 /DNA_ORIENTATION=+